MHSTIVWTLASMLPFSCACTVARAPFRRSQKNWNQNSIGDRMEKKTLGVTRVNQGGGGGGTELLELNRSSISTAA